MLASVQVDIDNVVHTDACFHIRQYFSQQQEHQGGQPQQGGSQEQEQRQQRQDSEGPAPAAATAVRSQDKAVRYVGLAADGEVLLRNFSCMCCDVWSVVTEAVACAPATPMQPQTIFADQLLWFFHHLTIGDSAVSATAFCAALTKMSERPVDDRSFLPAYQRWRHVVRPLKDPDELAAHLQKIAAQPGSSFAFWCPPASWLPVIIREAFTGTGDLATGSAAGTGHEDGAAAANSQAVAAALPPIGRHLLAGAAGQGSLEGGAAGAEQQRQGPAGRRRQQGPAHGEAASLTA